MSSYRVKFKFGRLLLGENRGALLLAGEVLRKQIATPHVSERSLESCDHYSAVSYKAKTLLDKGKNTADGEVRTIYTADCLQPVVRILESTVAKLPLYIAEFFYP